MVYREYHEISNGRVGSLGEPVLSRTLAPNSLLYQLDLYKWEENVDVISLERVRRFSIRLFQEQRKKKKVKMMPV